MGGVVAGLAGRPGALAAAKATIRAGFPAALRDYRDTGQRARQDPALADDQRAILAGPVPVPALVLHGQQDGCIPPGAFAEAGSFLAPGSEVVGVPGVGHFPHLEDAVGNGARIVSFLRRPS